MSNGVKIFIPDERHDEDCPLSYNISVDEAIRLIAQAAEQAGKERVRGDPDLEMEPFVWGPEAERILDEAKDELRPAYGWM